MAGYQKARSDWISYQSPGQTLIRQGDLDQWEQAIYDLKHGTWTVQDPAESMTITPASGQGVQALKVVDGPITANSQVSMDGSQFNPSIFYALNVLRVTGTGRGSYDVTRGLRSLEVFANDSSQVVNKTVSGATNASPIVVTTSTAHTFLTDDWVNVYGVTGNTAANGKWKIIVLSSTTFSLNGSTGNGAYVSGGTATNRPLMYAASLNVSPSLARGGGTGAQANFDDVDGLTVQNVGTALATDAVYIAASPSVTGAAWVNGFSTAANFSFAAFLFGGTTAGYGLDLDANHGAVYSGGAAAIRLPNTVPVVGRNNANNADVWMFYLDSTDNVQMFQTLKTGDISIGDGNNVNLGGTTGTKLGLDPTQKLGFWNKAPIVRPTGWAAATNTKTRTTFDTTTVTLPVLAAHVGALMDDLIAMGLIGA